MKFLRNAAICLFLLLIIAMVFFQSDWVKKIAVDSLQETLQESGIQVKIGTYKGAFPHAIRLTDVQIESDQLSLSIDSLNTRLSLFALLRKEFLFTDIRAQGIAWQEHAKTHLTLGKKGGLKFGVTVKHFELTDVHIEEDVVANLEGSARVGRKNQDAYLDIKATRLEFPDSTLRVRAYLDEAGMVRAKGSFKSPTLDALPFSFPFDAAADLKFVLLGKEHLSGRISGTLTPSSIEIAELAPYVERKWTIDSRIARKEGVWSFSHLKAENDLFSLGGKGTMTSALINVKTDHPQTRSNLEINRLDDGSLALKGTLTGYNLDIQSLHMQKIKAGGHFIFKDNAIEGRGETLAIVINKVWKATSDFSWEKGDSLFLKNATLLGPSASASGDFEIRPDKIILGTTDLFIENLHEISPHLYGKVGGKAHFFISAGQQVTSLDLHARDFVLDEFFANQVAIEASLIDPFKNPQGRVVLSSEQLKWQKLTLDRLELETLLGSTNQHFSLTTSGRLKHPLELNLQGLWHYENNNFLASLESGSGSFYNHPLILESKVDFEYGPKHFLLSPLNLSFSRARLGLLIESTPDESRAELNLEHFPLDILSINPLDIAINGETDCKISFHEKKGKVDGMIDAKVNGENSLGEIKGQFDNEKLTLSGKLLRENSPLLDLDLSLPIKIEMRPPSFELVYKEKVGGHLAFHGQIEEILDFFDLGNHRIEGDLACDFRFKNTLENPKIQGNFSFQNGSYENYLTGTLLSDIEASGMARKDTLHLDSFKAHDGNGSVLAKGKIALSPLDDFPFHFDVLFDRFQITDIDLVTSEIEGKIQIVGTTKTALAKGDLEILETNLHIPNKIPRSFPNLAVVYRNVEKPISHPPTTAKAPYPLKLDINVKAPESIFIDGRGLDSEWKGNFHVGGTYTDLSALGKLELINGEFLFSGREFKLLDGSLSFRGKEHEMPSLNLIGQMQIKEIVITAQLKGPLNNPQLTLQSVPPLPLGTIMSYLLFGQELAEINSFQALQLANSVASLAGQGPDVMETTRKALGVDRLNIVSIPSDDVEVEDTIALQVGKYVSEGVLVSLTQGAEDASPDISIAIEISGGWTVQLDSDQRQEQGKFTVRWNHTY